MDLHLKGKTALVTGSSKGIGRAVAELLAAEGCSLHLTARTESDLDGVAETIRSTHGVAVTTHPLDLSERGAAADLASTVDPIDILVNNAGAIPAGSLDNVDEDMWRVGWDLKVFGYINLIRAVYPMMRERNDGVIVNVIGTGGERPTAGYIAGAGGNASLMAFTRAMGGKSPDDGIRVVAVNPGPVQTERWETQSRRRAELEGHDPDTWNDHQPDMPFGRICQPGEVADIVAFLASDRSSYISGTVVTIDGGLVSR